MRLAFVHDRRINPAGAEAVFRDLIHTLPHDHAVIFCLLSTQYTLTIHHKKYQVRTAFPIWLTRFLVWLHSLHIPFLTVLSDYRNTIVILPLLVTILRWKVQRYRPDRVVISSFAGVKNIVPQDATHFPPTMLYLHSPMQYIRENYGEYMEKLRERQRWIFVPLARYLRKWDSLPRIYDPIYTNSHYTASCAHKYYNLSSEVAYPRIHEIFLRGEVVETPKEYMVFIGRLVRFVREVDRIILLANATQMPLLLIGSWPDEGYLKSLAWPTVIFLGQLDDPETKKDVLRHARWLINIAKESAWLATMEALSCGVPVLWFAAGATPELVWKDGWVLVNTKDQASLLKGRERFQAKQRKRKDIQESFRARYEQTRVERK